MCNCDRNVRIKEVQNTLLQYNCSNVFYISYFTEAYKDILTRRNTEYPPMILILTYIVNTITLSVLLQQGFSLTHYSLKFINNKV